MTGNAKELEAIVAGQYWDIPYLDRLRVSMGEVGDALSTLSIADAWTGMAADQAAEAIRTLSKRILAVHYQLGGIRNILDHANTAKDIAANAEARLPGSWIPDWVHDKVREGSSVFWPPLGEVTAERAIQAISDVLDQDREKKAREALDALKAELADLITKSIERRTHIDDQVLKKGEINPSWSDNGSGGGGGGNNGSVSPPPRMQIANPYLPPPFEPGPPDPPGPTDPPGPGPSDDDPNTNGPRVAVDGDTHGSAGGFGGAGALGAGGAALAAGKLGGTAGTLGGGAESGSGAGAGAGGGAGAKGNTAMMGGGGGGRGGGGQQEKRGGLGLVAPKLEDDEPTTPRSAAAGAGGRE